MFIRIFFLMKREALKLKSRFDYFVFPIWETGVGCNERFVLAHVAVKHGRGRPAIAAVSVEQ